MKRFLAITASLICCMGNEMPANALPTWAKVYANSHCEYLALGATWKEAVHQSIRDNLHWQEEIQAAGTLGKKAMLAAVNQTCRNLENKAYSEYEKSKGTQPAAM